MEAVGKENEMPVAEAKGKRIGQVMLDLILFAVLSAFLFTCIKLFFLFVFKEGKQEEGMDDMRLFLWNEALMLGSVFLAAWMVLGYRKLPLAGLGLSLKGQWKDGLKGGLLAVVLYAVGFGLSWSLGAVEVVGIDLQPACLLTSLLFFLLVGVTEELAVRGFILGRMLDGGIPKFVALTASSVIFSLLHVSNPNFAVVPFLNILLAGGLLGASYLYTRNLCFPIALHWFWNWLQGPVLGYEVSGNKFGGGMLVLHLPEDSLLNGGSFGFEGSVLCSVLLVAATVVVIRVYKDKGRGDLVV